MEFRLNFNQKQKSNFKIILSAILLFALLAFGCEYLVDATWLYPSSLTDNISPDGQDTWDPKVAMDNNGNFILTWFQSDGTNNQVFISEYKSGTWTYPSSLTDNISFDGQSASHPYVAIDNNGNAIIAWSQNDGTNTQIFKSEYRSGTWTHPTDLTDNISPDGQNANEPKVAMDENGNAIITWSQSDGTNSQVFKSEYRSGTWTHPAGLADNISPDGQNVMDLEIVMDNSDNDDTVRSQRDITVTNI